MSLEVSIRKKLPSFTLDVSFMAGSEVVGFLGASGCGKSLTLRCIAGVDTPDEGRIVVNGQVFFDSEARVNLSPQRRKTALLFQNYQLFSNMTVAQNVAAGLSGALTKAEREAAVRRYLALFSLQGFEERWPLSLSGGQQQRVALARMLAAEPGILMLDEPFSALDSHLKVSLERNMLDVFDRFDGTVLYVTHDIDEAYRLCDRVAVVSGGRIEEMGTAEQVVMHPVSLAALKLSGCRNISRARKAGAHTVEALDWGMTLDVRPEVTVPEGLRYVGARENFVRLSKGEAGKNHYELEVLRVVENRFDCQVMLVPPNGNRRVPLYWNLDKGNPSVTTLPQVGDVVAVHFDARHLHMVTR